MSIINISHLTFAYDGSYDNIFDDVSFQLDSDWRLGFCGRNGRGKTTFMKLLMGKHEFRGSITANVNFEYFPYEVPDMSEFTMDILNTVAPDALDWQIRKEFSKLNLDEDTLYRPFSTLSNGERTKALLAALFLRENSFLLIDEPTNHLDMEARQITADYLNTKSGFILVSHDRAFLDNCVDHILSINKTNIEIQSGNFSSWYYNKGLQDAYETERNDQLKTDIKRLTATAREKSQWSDKTETAKIGTHQADRGYVGHMAAKMMKRSKAIEQRIEREIDEKSGLLKNIESADSLKIKPLEYHSDKFVSLYEASLFYGEKEVCGNISLTLERGDRLTVCGGNGSGKSTLIKLICGEKISYKGTVNIGSRLVVSYVPQDASFLSGSLEDYISEANIDESQFKTILRKLDFSRLQFEKDMSEYSAGQKKKVLIARSLCEKAHLYVWDEPLNYIDILSRIQIEELILNYEPTLLFVEHDRAFCDNIATKTVYL